MSQSLKDTMVAEAQKADATELKNIKTAAEERLSNQDLTEDEYTDVCVAIDERWEILCSDVPL